MNKIILLLFIITFLNKINAEIFTSSAALKRLINIEREIPKLISNYISLENERLEQLRNFADNYRQTNEKFQMNVENVSNPINAFLMIKRQTKAWKEIQHKMRSDVADHCIKNISASRETAFPEEEDIKGAAVGLFRLQDTYNLEVKDLANGIVQGKMTRAPLTAHDCFEIGRVAYFESDFYHSLMWMEQALEKFKDELSPAVKESDILDHYAYTLFKQGNLKRALIVTDRLYLIDHRHPRAKSNIRHYEDQLETQGVHPSEFRKNVPPLRNLRPINFMEEEHRILYETLCRDEFIRSPNETSKLYCYYKMDWHYLRLAPIKVEIVNLNPLAIVFRGVISDYEISKIMELSIPRLNRATVQNPDTGMPEGSHYRISKSAWLGDYDHEVIDRISKRVTMMTNLMVNSGTAEELQIANYGIGGHYDVHYDFAKEGEGLGFAHLGMGNRIATVLFYMSQPEKGGHTAFTEFKTSVSPSIHDALFWYNLHTNGTQDYRTMHAACPVLLGEKWISNKWIHEKGQEFMRPCGLYPSSEERYIGDRGGLEPRYHWNI